MDKTSIKTPAQTLIENYSHGNEQKSFLSAVLGQQANPSIFGTLFKNV